MCILELSNVLMYGFHYNYIKRRYGLKARLLFTDTDSLTYEIETEDAYQDFWRESEYKENFLFYDKSNNKVIGKFKGEAAGVPIAEFIGMLSKMYSYIK